EATFLPKSWSILSSHSSWFKCQRAYAIRPYRNIVKYSPRSHVYAKILVHPLIPLILVHILILVHPRIPSILVQLLNTSISTHPFIHKKRDDHWSSLFLYFFLSLV